jgi:hypothetical protein
MLKKNFFSFYSMENMKQILKIHLSHLDLDEQKNELSKIPNVYFI